MAVINKFHNSKIYTIRSPYSDLYYIGATTQSLCRRLTNHKADYDRYLKGIYHNISSFKIIELGDAYIELLEEFKLPDKGLRTVIYCLGLVCSWRPLALYHQGTN